MKQIYKITYPTGKIYIGKDSYGSYRYFGNPNIDVVNADFERLPEAARKDYTVRKQILWESDTATEAELALLDAISNSILGHLTQRSTNPRRSCVHVGDMDHLRTDLILLNDARPPGHPRHVHTAFEHIALAATKRGV